MFASLCAISAGTESGVPFLYHYSHAGDKCKVLAVLGATFGMLLGNNIASALLIYVNFVKNLTQWHDIC